MVYIRMENIDKLIEGKFYRRIFVVRIGLCCKGPGRR